VRVSEAEKHAIEKAALEGNYRSTSEFLRLLIEKAMEKK
jgi:hypothetical protein